MSNPVIVIKCTGCGWKCLRKSIKEVYTLREREGEDVKFLDIVDSKKKRHASICPNSDMVISEDLLYVELEENK